MQLFILKTFLYNKSVNTVYNLGADFDTQKKPTIVENSKPFNFMNNVEALIAEAFTVLEWLCSLV